MKKTKLRLLLLLFFIGGLIILPQKAKAAEKAADIIPVKYFRKNTDRRKLEQFLI